MQECTKCKENPKYTNSSWCKECINTRKRELRSEKKALGLKKYGENRKKTCSKCGLQKEEHYMNDSLCQLCRSETNRDIRILKRAHAGLSPWGSGRKKTCSKCGEKKEPGRDNESCCISCKANAGKINRAAGRLEMGLNPLGFGRKETCCRCGEIKENINHGYCHPCKSKNDSDNRFVRVSTEEGKIEERLSYAKKATDPDFRLKKIAREILNKSLWVGITKKQPCEICGNQKVEGHHDDYMKPLDVRWLCRKHHVEFHCNEKQITKKG